MYILTNISKLTSKREGRGLKMGREISKYRKKRKISDIRNLIVLMSKNRKYRIIGIFKNIDISKEERQISEYWLSQKIIEPPPLLGNLRNKQTSIVVESLQSSLSIPASATSLARSYK